MARRKEQASEGAPEWMTTYSDLVTLLLTFFILLFSFSTINKQKFDEVARSLSATFMKFDGGNSILSGSGNSIITVNFVNPSDEQKAQQKEKYIESAEEMVIDAQQQINDKKMDAAKEEIRQMIEAEGLDDKVQVVEEKDFILVRLDSEVFFESGSAEINPEGLEVLRSISETLRAIENAILISGHTDNVPISTGIYKSNWELSTARATNVVRYFVEELGLDPTKFTATGNGEFQPVGDNNTPEGRQRNRRIEIKIMK